MNPLQKNIALWLIISLIFVLLYNLFNQPKNAQDSVIFSDFIAAVEKGQVVEVSIQGENISGKFVNGKSFKTYAPKEAGVVPLLKEKGV
ncbi:MAG TPA: ATP-dependent metallopeptidase FtsH/Yme1/Tma family protein, partial [Syntrophales bacterium]|nr:ATP-dependent metallopeptidase FtsH/Yme1/Tma family protein [Syntrophales bacterium]